MALTLGTTGMDSSTQGEVQAAFKAANAELGGDWILVADDNADYVVVDMDSLYGPMSWLRLHAAGRKVIGLTSMDKNQTDYRLPRPVSARDFQVLLSEIAIAASSMPASDGSDTDVVATPGSAARTDAAPPAAATPVASTPAPMPADRIPDAAAVPDDEVEATPALTPAMAGTPTTGTEPEAAPEPVVPLPPDRPLAVWLAGSGLERRVRLQRGDGPALLLDPRGKVYHGPATLKPLAPCFEGTLLLEDFETPDAAAWETEAAALGPAQPLGRLQWLGALLAGGGTLLPGHDPEGRYRLTKWPQTEREFPKHFRIATAMMKGPSTLDEIAAASGVERTEIADFVNANLATGYAEVMLPPSPEPDTPVKQGGGLFGRMRGR